MPDEASSPNDKPIESPLLQLILHAAPTSGIAESFRTARANVARALQSGTKSILVVSTWPNDGKSMVSANLAVSLAQIGKSVVLADADLRRPTLTELFGEGDRVGLANALESDRYPVATLLRKTIQPGLRFLPSGPLPAHPSDLVGGSRTHIVLSELRDVCDCILLDTPPLSVCSDAMVLAGLVDGVILIINPRLWEGERELRAKETLEGAGATILGAILNEVEERDVNYAAYHYYGTDYPNKKSSAWNFWGGGSKNR